jgi:hypothetical protein
MKGNNTFRYTYVRIIGLITKNEKERIKCNILLKNLKDRYKRTIASKLRGTIFK